MNRDELNNQVNKMMSFKENESNKIIALKKLFTSHKFIELIIGLIIYSLTTFAYTLLANLLSLESITITVANVTEIVFSSVIGVAVPLIFICYLMNIYKLSKITDLNDINPKNSLLNNLFTLRRILKVLLILVSVIYVLDGIFYLSAVRTIQSNPEIITKYQEMGINLTNENIKMFQELGYEFIIYGCIISLLTYGCLKAYKIFFLTIFNDRLDRKPFEAYISVFLIGLFGLCHFVGSLLGIFGISNPLGGTGSNSLVLNIFDLVNSVAILAVSIFICNILLSIVKILKEIKGSCNPLDNDKTVYTINMDD